LSQLLSHQYVFYAKAMAAVFYAAYLYSVFRDFSFKQPDIIMAGKLFSSLFVILTNMLIITLVVFYLTDDLHEYHNLYHIESLTKFLTNE
jgi:hypothetical protein